MTLQTLTTLVYFYLPYSTYNYYNKVFTVKAEHLKCWQFMITITESEVNTDGTVGAYVPSEHDGMTLMLWYFLRDISEPADASCLNNRVLSNRRNISGQFGRASFDLKRRRMTLLHHAPTFTFPGTRSSQRQADEMWAG